MIQTLKSVNGEINSELPHYCLLTQFFINESTGDEYKGEFKIKHTFNEETCEATHKRFLQKFYKKENDEYILLTDVGNHHVIDHHAGNSYINLTIDF